MNQKMLDILQEHVDRMTAEYGDDLILSYGFGHIVYGDYNTDDSDIDFCIKEAQQSLYDLSNRKLWPAFHDDFSEEDYISILKDTISLLEELKTIPEEEREVWEEIDFNPMMNIKVGDRVKNKIKLEGYIDNDPIFYVPRGSCGTVNMLFDSGAVWVTFDNILTSDVPFNKDEIGAFLEYETNGN